jgi:membrane fusion protein (multidrug efflux system)
VLFALLPLVLIGGGYWYVTGGQTVSMDDAYVESDKVGVSTDVAGIVREVDVSENQHVETGQVLYRLDDLPFQLAVARADAQIGVVRDALNALKANYRDMQAQIDQAHNDVSYYDTEFQRQQGLLSAHVASQATFDAARRNLQNAQQKLASLAQQPLRTLTAIRRGRWKRIPATSMQWRSETRPHDNWRIRSCGRRLAGSSQMCRPSRQANISKLQ